ncbi:hypothetical protein ABPG77_005385 [Micractinium sp. CCAP 211/92]
MLSGHKWGSPHSLAPTVDSLRTPAPLGGHLARSSPPVEQPLVKLPLSRKRQATRGAVVDLAPHFHAAAVAAGQQKRARVAPAAPALALAGEPAWASSLTRALREATTATRADYPAVAGHPGPDFSQQRRVRSRMPEWPGMALNLAWM